MTQALGATYWKPVQAGLQGETDSQTVARLSGRPVLREAYRLKMPASPHLAAEDEGLEIDPGRLVLPEFGGLLVVEGAGGLMVPLNRKTLVLDTIADWNAPVVLCARTALGTINHTLLSLMALRGKGCEVLGVAFVGDPVPAVEQTICEIGAVKRLGRFPMLDALQPDTVASAFAASFDVGDFAGAD